MSKGGGAPTEQNVTTTTSNLPEYARPYYENALNRAQAQSYQEYTPYPNERIAGFNPAQQQVQQNVLGMGAPNQFADGSALAGAAGLGSLAAADYQPSQFSAQQIGMPELQQYRMTNPNNVDPSAWRVNSAPGMEASQAYYKPALESYQMEGPGTFDNVQAERFMSPYMQQVVDVQKSEAIRDAQKGQLSANLAAARQGTYGGARQTLAMTERERNLMQQLGQIQATGSQSAFQQAQQQFNTEDAAIQGTRGTNLQARLGVQNLGTDVGLRTTLANLDANTQARVQNLAAQLQTQGLNADQALRAALANQQTAANTGQQNLSAAMQTQQLGVNAGLDALKSNQQASLEAQRLAEQSNQFGATNTLAGLGQAGQMAQTLGTLGQYEQTADLQRLQAQANVAGQGQALEQQQLDQMYADFLRQRDYPMEQLGQFNSILRGMPMTLNSTQTTYAPPPSMASQVLGTGLGALGMAKTLA